MKSVLLAIMAYLILSGTPQATAQNIDRAPRHEAKQALRAEMRSWFESSVKPTLLEWKRDFDASLSAEDLATLNELRAEAKANRERRKAANDRDARPDPKKRDTIERKKRDTLEPKRRDSLDPKKRDTLEPKRRDSLDPKKRDTLEPKRRGPRVVKSDTIHGKRHGADEKRDRFIDKRDRIDGKRDRADNKRDSSHIKRHGIIERLKPIAERSRATLQEIFENGSEQIREWREESKDIVRSFNDARENAPPAILHHGFGPFSHGMGRHMAIRFMLWDGTMPDEAEAGFNAAPTGINDASSTLSSPLLVAPLPAENVVSLSMQELPNGAATIEIFNMDGVLMKTLPVHVAGNALSEFIDVSSLNAGNYMVSVNTATGRRTSQIIVTR